MIRALISIVVSATLVVFGLAPGATANEQQEFESLIVKSSVDNPNELRLFRGQDLETLAPDTYILSLPRSLSFDKAKNVYQRLEHVEYVEPNLPVEVEGADDTEYLAGNLWGMENGFGSNAESAWSNGFTGSGNVYIAVIDSGIDYSHPDLASNIWTNSGEVPGNGIDDDGNGYIDDVHGYDFLYDDGSVKDTSENPHGTHVAGTIGAVGNNGAGVAGVNHNIKLISAKISNSEGKSTIANAIRAIDYVTNLRTQKGLDIVATNNSWGGVGYSKALEEAVQRGGDAGIAFVAAAGNSAASNDGSEQFPGNLDCSTELRDWDCIVTVAALEKDGSLADYSNYGSQSVDIAAPGSEILSTQFGGGYVELSGTSMAAPHVTGALALCVAANPGAGAERAIRNLYSSAVATDSVNGKVATNGRLDVSSLVSLCANQQSSFSGSPENHLATALYTNTGKLEWDDTTSGEHEYKIEVNKGSEGCYGSFEHYAYIGPELTSYPLAGLDESEFYCFRIKALSGGAESDWQKSNVMITWTSNLPFIGGTVYLSDGTTPVAGIEMNWLPSGSSIATEDRNAVRAVTDKNGDFLLQVSNGVKGQLYAETSRYAGRDEHTRPLTPWGLWVVGELTVNSDTSVDFKLPEQTVLNFNVYDADTGNPVSGAKIKYSRMAESCDYNIAQPFPTATDTFCRFWPTGIGDSNPVSDASGNISVAILDRKYNPRWPELWQFSIEDPATGRFADVTINPYETSSTVEVPLQGNVTLSGVVTSNDGSTPIQGIEMNWLPEGTSISLFDRNATTSVTDSQGKFSMEVPPGVTGQIYAETSRQASRAVPTVPGTPWGMVAAGNLSIDQDTEIQFGLPKQHILNFTVVDEETGNPVSGAQVKFPISALSCARDTYDPFEGHSSDYCRYWPSGIGSFAPRTNSEGKVSIAILDKSYNSRWKDSLEFSVIDSSTGRFKEVTVSEYADAEILVEIKSKVTVSGRVLMSDGETAVSGIEMNWLPKGSSPSLEDRNAISAVTDANGEYSIEVPAGSPGQFYVETSRKPSRSTPTNPPTPWGLVAGAQTTVSVDTDLDFVLPKINTVTFKVVDWSTDDVVKGAKIYYPDLAESCDANSFTPFEGAESVNCRFWPAGSVFEPVTNSNGEVTIAMLDGSNGSRWPSKFEFRFSHPKDLSRVKNVSFEITGDANHTIELPGTPSRPEQPEVTPLTDKAILTWDEPWNGGAFIDFYKVWQAPNADGPFTEVQDGTCAGNIAPDLRACEVEGLEPGTTTYFAIIAHNVYGYSELSLASAATTKAPESSESDEAQGSIEGESETADPDQSEPDQKEDPEPSESEVETPTNESTKPEETEDDQPSITEESGSTEDSEANSDASPEEESVTEESQSNSDLKDGEAEIDESRSVPTKQISEDSSEVTISVGQMNLKVKPSSSVQEDESIEVEPNKPSEIQASGLQPNSSVKVFQIQGNVSAQPTLIGVGRTDSSGSADLSFMLWKTNPGERVSVRVLATEATGRAAEFALAAQVASEDNEASEEVSGTPETTNDNSAADTKVNAGSFKGYVAIYAKGHEGKRLSAKVGKDWIVIPELASRFERVVDFIGQAGVELEVRIYIDRKLEDTIEMVTRK